MDYNSKNTLLKLFIFNFLYHCINIILELTLNLEKVLLFSSLTCLAC